MDSQNSLEKGSRDFEKQFLKKSLSFLSWLIALCSNLFFFSVISDTVEKLLPLPFLGEVIIGFYSYWLQPLSERFVRRTYRPNFISESEASSLPKVPARRVLVLSEEDYEYRKQGEILLRSNLLQIPFNLILGALITSFAGVIEDKLFMSGILSVPCYFFAILGIGFIGARAEKTGRHSLVLQLVGLLFVCVPLAYAGFTVKSLGIIGG